MNICRHMHLLMGMQTSPEDYEGGMFEMILDAMSVCPTPCFVNRLLALYDLLLFIEHLNPDI